MLHFAISSPHYLALASVCADGTGWVGSWCPGIGDPTFVGWLTVVAYAACTWLSYRNIRALSSRTVPHALHEKWIWVLLLCSFAALGVNKQLDLQSAMTEAFRQLAHTQGWYEQRREYQRAFIEVVALSAVAAAIAIVRLTWSLPRAVKVAGLGLCMVVGYVLIRAASFHYMDALIGATILTVKVNWLLELTGLVVAAVGAWSRYRSLSKSKRSAQGDGEIDASSWRGDRAGLPG